jgi:hypothetical protein
MARSPCHGDDHTVTPCLISGHQTCDWLRLYMKMMVTAPNAPAVGGTIFIRGAPQ